MGGVVGSIIAGVFVKSLDLSTVRWLVIAVVVYTAVTMLLSAMSDRSQEEPSTAGARV